jgi:hypothetical protein
MVLIDMLRHQLYCAESAVRGGIDAQLAQKSSSNDGQDRLTAAYHTLKVVSRELQNSIYMLFVLFHALLLGGIPWLFLDSIANSDSPLHGFCGPLGVAIHPVLAN